MIAFSGIRYARADRFCMPVQEPSLESLEQLRTEVIICPQSPSRLDDVIGKSCDVETQSEDCLRLAVYTPALDGKRPVIVWIHGGAFLTGSGLCRLYDGTVLAFETDAVVVCVSYRLGAFGFLYDPSIGPVNLGMEDQLCALRWIKENIAVFGGDPGRVTLMGQSAGGYSVLFHIANVQERLFTKAIVMSAPFASTGSGKMAQTSRKFKELLRSDPKTASVQDILKAQDELAKASLGMPFSAVSDNLTSPESIAPGLSSFLLYCQKDDAMPFVPFRWMTRIATSLIFMKPMYRYAAHLRKKNIHTVCRLLDWRHGVKPFGAVHCMELPLLFGSYDTWKDAPFMHGVSENEYNQKSKQLKSEIASFVNGILQ